jgi:hypothetical protein
MALLCVGAMAFLLRFLLALLREGMHSTSRTAHFYFARFAPSPQSAKLFVVTHDARERNIRTDSRLAG